MTSIAALDASRTAAIDTTAKSHSRRALHLFKVGAVVTPAMRRALRAEVHCTARCAFDQALELLANELRTCVAEPALPPRTAFVARADIRA